MSERVVEVRTVQYTELVYFEDGEALAYVPQGDDTSQEVAMRPPTDTEIEEYYGGETGE